MNKKKVLIVFLTLVIMLGTALGVSFAVYADGEPAAEPVIETVAITNKQTSGTMTVTFNIPERDPVPYIDTDGTQTQTGPDCYDIYQTDTSLGYNSVETWYVVRESMTIDVGDTFKILGDVRLIIGDGATFTVQNGISIDGGSLTVYAQSTDPQTMGKLVANALDGSHAAIGSSGTNNPGSITINGGIVTATGNGNSAALGGGAGATNVNVTVNGGVVNATGSAVGAAIGGKLTVSGGTVNANGGENGAAISGNITVNDGTVHATGGTSGAAISGSTTVSGGTVTANGGANAAAIGGNITVNDGTVHATGGTSGAAIQGGTITVSGGTVTANGGENGVAIGGTLTVSGGTVNATAGSGATAINATLAVNGGTVNATCGENGAAISGATTVKGGTVNATAGSGATAIDATLTVSGGIVIAMGEPALSGTPTFAENIFARAGDSENAAVDTDNDQLGDKNYVYIAHKHTVKWLMDNGSLLDTTKEWDGDIPKTNVIPNKTADAHYSYTFTGWTPKIVAATEDATYTATFSGTVNSYTVTWQNADGTVLETDNNVLYGVTPEYNGKTPTFSGGGYTYTYHGWDKNIVPVTGNVTYTAIYTTSPSLIGQCFPTPGWSQTVTYTLPPVATYFSIPYVCGGLIENEGYVFGPNSMNFTHYGSSDWQDLYINDFPIVLDSNPPTSIAFSSSDAGLFVKSGSGTPDDPYVCEWYNRKVTITFKDEDGTVIDTMQDIPVGSIVAHADVTKEPNASYSYNFTGWTDSKGNFYAKGTALPDASSDETYTANIEKIKLPGAYKITIAYKSKGNTVTKTLIASTSLPYKTTGYAMNKATGSSDADAVCERIAVVEGDNIGIISGTDFTFINAGYEKIRIYDKDNYYYTYELNVTLVSTLQAGQYIRMGTYNGVPVDWYCQRINGTGIMMLCKYALKADKFGSNATYSTSNIHAWLEGSFATDIGLTKAELSIVRSVNLSGTAGDGSDTFIIPAYGNDELNSGQTVKAPYNINNQSSIISIYWLRTARDTSNARVVNHSKDGSPVATVSARYSNVGNYQWIRPMFYLAGDTFLKLICGGTGTENDPFIIEPKYIVSANTPANGTVSITATRDSTTINSGSTPAGVAAKASVMITATPAAGYQVKSITVQTADGTNIALSNNTFTMPYKDVIITAEFEKQKFDVLWKNYDGTVLETDEKVEYGATTTYEGETPTRPADAQYTYTFSGWSPAVGAINGATTYTAQYSTTVNTYDVTFKNYDGTVLQSGIFAYGTVPSFDGTEPATTDGTFFTGWTDSNDTFHAKTKTLPAVSGNVTFTATFFDKQTIGNVDEWNDFAAAVNGGNTYSGTIVELTADVGTVTAMVNGAFSGILDGNGHTLTVNISGGSAAAFATAQNAVFQNLTLAGTVTGSGNHTAALVKSVVGSCTIENVDIVAEVSNTAAYIGGFIGHAGSNNSVVIENSTFNGSITKTGGEGYYIGGFVGWQSNLTCTINNCAFTGTYNNIKSFNSVGFGCSNVGTVTVTGFYSNVSDTYNYTKNSSIRMYTGTHTATAALVDSDAGRTFYTAFADAYNAWTDGSTLKLLADTAQSSQIAVPADTSKTLDLNGKVLTVGATIAVNGTLTVHSTAAGGSIIISAKAQVISAGEGATLNINGGTINGYNADRAVIGGNGTYNLNGGKIATPASNAFSLGIGATLNLNAGEIECTSASTSMGVASAVWADGSATVNWRGTAITTNTGDGIIMKSAGNGAVNISGGSFTATNETLPADGGYAVYNNNIGSLNLQGNPEFSGRGVYLSNGKVINITGELSNTTPIGVKMEIPGVFTYGLSGKGDATDFAARKGNIELNADGEALFVPLYDVIWMNGDEVLEIDTVFYGEMPAYDGATPVKESTEAIVYVFKGWTPAVTAVTGDVTYTAEYSVTFNYAHFSQDDDTYTIHDEAGWEAFCECLLDTDTYNGFSGKTVVLDADITATRKAGSDTVYFKGIFDGNGHKITANINDSSRAALFAAISGATIKNLAVDGSVTGAIHCAGLVSYTLDGTANLIENVAVNVAVTTTGSHCGGILGHGGKNTTNTLRGCSFTGSITGGTHIGVLYGWGGNSTPTIENCIEAGTAYTGANVNPVGLISTWGTVKNTYYYNATKGSPAQSATRGVQVHTVTAGENMTLSLGEGTVYSVSGITAYGVGVSYNGTFYAGADDRITLTNTPPEGYALKEYVINAGTVEGNTLIMPDEDVTISVVFEEEKVKYASISLNGDIALNFYVRINGAGEGADLTANDGAYTGVYDSVTGCMKFSVPVAAKDFKNKIDFVIDGRGDISVSYSVEDYIDRTESTSPAYELVQSLKEYCEAASAFFAAEEVVREDDFSDSEKTVLEGYRASVSGSDTRLALKGVSLVLRSTTSIYVYFTSESLEGLTFTVDGANVVPEHVSGNSYAVKIENVVAKDLNKTFEIGLGDYAISYSALSYVNSKKSVDDDALFNVVKALYYYSVVADAYFG